MSNQFDFVDNGYTSAEELEAIFRKLAIKDRCAAILVCGALEYVAKHEEAKQTLCDWYDFVDAATAATDPQFLMCIDYINEVFTASSEALANS